MLLTSWIRALRQTFSRRRTLSRVRRQVGAASPVSPPKLCLAEVLEERSLLSALVFDSTTFTSTAATPGVNITNSTLDANNDGISDFDNLVIASSDLPINVSGTGIGIRINLSNLTGLNHITIENVNVIGGAASQGISVILNNVAIQSLTVDQANVTTTNANGIDLNLQNIGTVGGANVTVKDSTVRSTNSTGLQVTLGSTTQNTRLAALTVADSILEGVSVTSTAGAAFQTLIDQTSVRNTRVQDGSANPVARNITYNLPRTTVGDLRVEENPLFRGLTVTTTDSPLRAVTIADNTNINVGAAGAVTGISLSATTTAAALGTTSQADVTNLEIRNNTIAGAVANINTVNGIALNLTNSNLGSYTNDSAGAAITGNTITNLSSNTGTAVGLQITASATAAFVAANDVATVGNNLPLLLDLFNGDNATGVRSTAAGDLNGIRSNNLTNNNGRELVVTTTANTTFLGNVTGNTFSGGNAGNRREGVVMSFTDRPTTAGFDSFNLLFDSNTVSSNRRGGVDLSLVNTAVGAMEIRNNVITNTEDPAALTPDALSISLIGANVVQQATNVLRKSFIEDNLIGITAAGANGQNSGNGVFINAQEQSEIQDLQIRRNNIANSGANSISILREDDARLTTVNPEPGQNRSVTIADNQAGSGFFHGILIDVRHGSTDLLDFEVRGNVINNSLGTGLHLIAEADARLLVDIIDNEIQFNGSDGILLDTVQNAITDNRQVGGTWIKNVISNNSRHGVNIQGRHGLFDEATGTRSPLFVGQEGIDPADGLSRGNLIENNAQFGVRVNDNGNGSNNGDLGIANNLVRGNLGGGLQIQSPQELLAVKGNTIVANQGIGLHLLSTGTVSATVRDNLITAQTTNAAGIIGDGVQITSVGGVMSLLVTNNFIDSNAGRGIDVLNGNNATLQLQIGNGTVEGLNTIVSNNLEGLYVVNGADANQSQNVSANVAMSANGDVFARPDMMLNVDLNRIEDNGINSGFNATGFVLRVGAVGSDGNAVSTAGQVGSSSGGANAGNGRVNSRVFANTFDGNFGNDFYVEPFLSTGPGNTGGQWDTNGFNPAGLQRDPLSRLNMVFEGNTGNGINVQNSAFFSNNEPTWKSRSSDGAVANPPGPFGGTARGRSVTNLRGGFDLATGTDTAAPFAPNFGAQFAYEALGPTTWQVEANFDTSGNNATFPFFNPNAGGASQNNFSDPTGLWSVLGVGAFTYPNVASPSLVTAEISVVADPSPVPVSAIRTSFTEFVTGVDLLDFQLLSHTIATTLTNSVPVGSGSFVVTNASVFPATPFDIRLEGETLRVTGVNLMTNTLTLLNPTTAVHNGSASRVLEVAFVVPLVDALNAPLAVVPDASTVDPNNPLAFKSYTIDLSFPTATAGNYELRVLTNDAVTVVRDTLPQVNGLGNVLVPVVDNEGVLQNYTASLNFTIDSVQPVGTISPVTPALRNAAAGIVSVTFSEPVSGVDIADFTLTRDGVPVNLGSIAVTQVSSSNYTLNLNQLTGAPGNYTLTLVSTDPVSPILDTANNPVLNVAGVASQNLWTVDTTLPMGSVTMGVPAIDTGLVTSPSNVPVGSVRINFSEAVTGVDISDLRLTRTDAAGTVSNVPLSQALTPLVPNTPQQYEVNLSAVTGAAGTYTLTVNAVNSGIFDLAQNAFETSFSRTFVLDLTAPVGDVVDVAPDPRQAPVDALNTIFTEAVNGLTIGQYVLAFDDGTSATGGTVSNATNAPTIVVTSDAHGLNNNDLITIYGVQGNTNANGVFRVMGTTPNTFQLFDAAGMNPVPGNGIYTSGGRWARSVNLGFLGAAALTMQTSTRFVANLASVSNNPGTYIVSLLANAGAVDAAGNSLQPATSALADIPMQLRDSADNPMTAAPAQFNVAGQDIWTYGPDVAPTGVITPLPAMIGTNAGMVEVRFSEPLQQISGASPVNLADFQLRLNGSLVSLTGVAITQTSATTFLVDLSSVTNNDGSYDFRLVTTDLATPIRDTAGNLLVPSVAAGIASQITWTKIATDPSVTSIKGIFQGSADSASFDTDPVTQTKLRAVQTLTINFSTDVTFVNGPSDASQYFRLTRQAGTGTGPVLPVSLDGLPITQITPRSYRINVSALTGADGRYAFTVLAGNLIQSTMGSLSLLNSRTIAWTKDGTIHVVPDDANNATNANKNSNALLTDGTDATSLGNEVVRTSAGRVTLRAAIQEANALAGDDSIELGVGTYVLTLGGVQEDFAVSGDLDIRENLTIRGKGAGQTIIDASGLPAAQRDRIFQIMAGATLNLQGVTLLGGSTPSSQDGGAILNSGTLILSDAVIGTTDATLVATKGNRSLDDGGAIANAGTATITRTTIAGNTATATGGAIRNTGTLNFTNSTLSGNTSTGNGGGLINVLGANATLQGVTISGNAATSGAGGGIRNDGTLRLINDTIANNRSLATQGGAGISRNGVITIGNTIVSDNLFTSGVLNDLSAGAFVSLGGNIIRTPGAAAGFGAQDQLNVNPGLQPLANYGGPTQTHTVLIGSAAIDRGLNANISAGVTTDQRGAPRRLDGPTAVFNAVDSGAIEFGNFFVNTITDTSDVNAGDGLAEDGLGLTSLRAAIMESNALVGESAILLDGQVYQLNRLAPDTTAPVVASILGVPTAPTTGAVGVVTITFSEDVAGFDLTDLRLTRTVGAVVTNIALTAPTFTLTQVSRSVYTINLTSATGVNGLYNLTVNSVASNIRDKDNNALANPATVNWVRGTDTFAPTVSINPIVSQPVINAGVASVIFSERVNGVSINNFSLTRNGVAVSLAGVTLANTQDPNFNGRTVVTLDLTTVSQLSGNYLLTVSPNVGANVTIRDTANNNLAAGTSQAWSKVEFAQFAAITTPRTSAVTTVTLQFSEPVAGLVAEDFTLTYDDGTGLGFQPVTITNPTLATLGAVVATPANGNAATQWTFTFTNNEAARDGLYQLNFDGLTNGNVLVTATGANFIPTTAMLPFQIGEDAGLFGDLDIFGGAAGSVQIIGVSKDVTTNVLGVTVNPSIIDGLTNDRLFDLAAASNTTITGVELRNGRVVFERNGGGIRNLGALTINSSDLLSSFADGNGGGISNGDSLNVGTLILNGSTLQSNSAGSVASGSQFGLGGAIFNQSGSVTITDSTFSSNVAFADGGVIYNDNSTTATISSSMLSNNSAGRDGGAVYNGDTSVLTILSTTLANNLADSDNDGDGEGGALFTEAGATLTLSTSILRSNSARAGGALYNDDASLTLDGNLFELNTARGGLSGALGVGTGVGGAIFNSVGGTLILTGGIFTTNSASDDGGAIQNYGTLGVTGTEFLNNAAGTDTRSGDVDDGRGGAIFNDDGSVILTSVEFNQNQSFGQAGAIFNQDAGFVSITLSTLNGNTAVGHAGAVYNDNVGQVLIDRSTFSNNVSSADGGGFYNNSELNSSPLSPASSQLVGNINAAVLTLALLDVSQFPSQGGFLIQIGTEILLVTRVTGNTFQVVRGVNGTNAAAHNDTDPVALVDRPAAAAVITSSTFAQNRANNGGAIFNRGFGSLSIQNSTLSANTATLTGGGLANFGSATLLNATVHLNDAMTGDGIASNSDGSTPLAQVNLKNTIVAGGSTISADLSGFDANFTDGGRNLIEDIGTITTYGNVVAPLNGNLLGDAMTPNSPQLDVLQDNGGPTFTHALLFGSLARDAGDNAGTTVGDQRGFTRIFDGDGNGIATVDIGAFESGFIINSFADTIDENINDGINADRFGVSTLRATIMQANARVGEDTIILSPGTYTLTLGGREEDGAATGDLDITETTLNIIGSGTDQTFIDGAQIDRIFHVLPGVTLNLSNLTLLRGNASTTDNGGAVRNQGTVALRNVQVLDSSAARGGAIFNEATGNLTVTNSLFRGNTAYLQGGALFNNGSLELTGSNIGVATQLSASLTNSRLTAAVAASIPGNSSVITLDSVGQFPTTTGFVIQVDAEQMLVTGIMGNTFTVTRGFNGTAAPAHVSGSGVAQTTVTVADVSQFPATPGFVIRIDAEEMRVTAISGNQFTVVRRVNGVLAAHSQNALVSQGNFANAHGGGLYNLGEALVQQNFFVGNVADSRGGAIYNGATAAANTLDIQQTTFADNFASSRGAALYNEDTLLITNSTISSNDSGTNAAIGNTLTGTVDINNSTVVDNVAFRGGGLANTTLGTVTVRNTILANNLSTAIAGIKAPNARGSFTTAGNNFVGNNADSAGFVNNVSFDQVGSSTSPFDPVIEGLSDNGGLTLTQAPRTGSPAIDAGNNTGAADKDTVDQRGAPRPTNDDSDVGSVERQDIHLVSITPNVMLPEGNAGSTPLAFTLTLNQASVEEVRIGYTLQGDTALAGEDFINLGGTAVFAPGTLIQTIIVNVNGDTSVEQTEQFFVNLVNPVNVTLDVNRAIGTIVTDDTGFRINDVNRVETDSGTQTYTFSVEVVGALLTTNASVNYIVSSSTGALTSAVTAGAMTVNVNNPNAFPTSGSFTIQVDSEQLLVNSVAGNVFNLAAPATASHNAGVAVALVGASTAAANIMTGDSTITVASAASFPSAGGFAIQVDNEFMQVTNVDVGTGVLTVTRATNGSVAAAHSMGATVTLVRTNAATGGNVDFIDQATPITLNFTAGATNPAPQSFTVTVNSDLNTEANENFFVHLTGSTLPFEFGKSIGIGTIFNDDLGFNVSNASANELNPPLTSTMQFNVSQRHLVYTSVGGIPTLASTTANVSTASGTATAGQDFVAVTQTLPFSAGTTTQSVTVTINGDSQFEVPNETFQLQVTGGTINTVADLNVATQSNNGTGTIVDNDPPPDQYHFYTYLNAGTPTIRVDRIATVLGVPTRTLVQETPQAGAGMISQAGMNLTDDLFVVDFNLYNSSTAASFAQYDTTGVIDQSQVVGNANPIPATGIAVDGLSQVGADTLRFQGGNNTFDSVVYDSTSGNSGSVTFSDPVLGMGVVTYVNLEPVLDLTQAVSRVFNAQVGTVNDNIGVSSSGGTVSISSNSAMPTFERILAFAPLSSLIINANSGDDTITGSSDLSFLGALTVNGGAGNDTINFGNWTLTSSLVGGNDNDTITGGSNTDTIDGGDGNDSILGGAGSDLILGGLGNDILNGNDGDDVVHGDDLNDVDPLGGNDTIQGNDGVDALFGGFGNDNVDGGAGNETVDGGSGDDIVSGGSGDDVVLGNNGNDTLSGGTGADSVDGGFGDDLMYGNDSVSGDGSADTINGQDGSDIIGYVDVSTAGNTFTLTTTQLMVGAEVEVIVDANQAFLVAGSGNNLMTATTFTGSVTMNGGGGLDTLLGGSGSDSLIGGVGNDSLVGNDGSDTINAGDGNDCISGGLGDDVMTGDIGVDTISGGDGNDNAAGGAGNDSITGGIGIDTLDGGDNNDTLFGNDDGDSLLGGAGQDSLDGGDGADSIDGGDGDDTAFGQTGNDDVRGGAGNDTLQGNDGDDSVNGMDGNDTLDGNLGRDTLFGGAGDDLMISTNDGDQLLGQGGSGDTFTFNGDNTIGDIFTITAVADPNPGTGRVGIGLARLNPGLSFTTVLLGVEVFTLNLNGGNDLVTISDLASVNDLTVLNINGGDGDDVIDAALSTSTTVSLRSFLGAGNDSVLGGAGNDTVQGEAGNDTILAGDGTDSLVGGDGNDSLNGNAGNDTINGGLGDDSIWGGGGNDLLTGLDGKDTIWGQAGNDTIDGGIGDDFLDGGYGVPESVPGASGTGNDSIRGGAGNDKIAGRDGADTLFGEAGDDTIKGGEGNDTIDAGDGNDLVSGDNGNDTINGGAGNDFLLGGFDNDRILGGAGNDTCVGEAGNDYVDGQGGTDRVLGGNGQGTNTKAPGDTVLGSSSEINELFKILTARPSIFNELNF